MKKPKSKANAELLIISAKEERAMLDLLAILHGDGGHYTGKHGLLKSLEDAPQAFYDKLAERYHEGFRHCENTHEFGDKD